MPFLACSRLTLKAFPPKTTLAQVEETLGLTDYERENYPDTDVRRFEKTTRFQTINAVKAGWMLKEKGIWSITDDGLAAYTRHVAAEPFYDEARILYRARDRAQKLHKRSGEAPDDNETAAAAGSATAEKAEETAVAEIWTHLATMNPYDFQELVAGVLQGMAITSIGLLRPARIVESM